MEVHIKTSFNCKIYGFFYENIKNIYIFIYYCVKYIDGIDLKKIINCFVFMWNDALKPFSCSFNNKM